MTDYFAYIRVSTVRQGEKGSSLQEQRSSIESFAQNQGLTISVWFEEMETAAKLGRPAFNQMMQALKNGQAQGVIIHKIDRSARNLKDWACLGELIDRGVQVHFAHEAIDLHSRGGRLLADIQAVVAADYIRNLRQEVLKGFYGRLKQGYYPLPAPMGYVDQGKAKAKTIDPVIGPLVREAFQLYASGEYSLLRLSDEMHARGLKAASGKPLHVWALRNTLSNPFYIGLIRIQRTNEVFDGVHEPLIGKKLFDRVEAVRAGRIVPRQSDRFFQFRKMIRCGSCGHYLSGERHKVRFVYYRCHARECTAKASVPEAMIHRELESRFASLHLDDEEMRDFRDLMKEAESLYTVEKASAEETLRLRIGRCDERLARLTDTLIDGIVDKEMFQTKKTALLLEKRELAEQLEKLRSNPCWTVKALQKLELGNMAYQGYISGNPEEKRKIAETLSSNFVGVGKNVEITLYFPFEELSKTPSVTYGGPRPVLLRTRPRELAVLWRKKFDAHNDDSRGSPQSPSSPDDGEWRMAA